MKQQPTNYADTFLSKLKEQSFTIMLLVGIMYYQNTLFTGQMNEYKAMIKAKEDLILKLTEEERQRLIDREKYLIGQRDEFIKELKEFGLNAWDKKIFLVRYKGFSNVVAEDEIKDWCSEVDMLNLSKDK